ncbi:hypothetical protein ACJJTC_017707 [Scirpophaga incertulas]
MCCFNVLSKIIILIINFVMILLGIGLIAAGSLLIFFRSSLPDTSFIDWNINTIAIFIISFGCFVFLVAFCGCLGAIADSGGLLITYAVLTFLLAALNIFLAVTLTTNKDSIYRAVGNSLKYLFDNSKSTFESIEYFLRCCGTTGVDSYINIGSNFPPTCCRNFSDIITDIDMIDDSDIREGFCNKDQTYDGCVPAVQQYVNLITDILFIAFIASAVIQLLIAICTIILANSACKKSKSNNGRVIHQERSNTVQMPHQQLPRPMSSQQFR